MIIDFIRSVLIIIVAIIILLAFLLGLPFGLYATTNYANYVLDKSYCTLLIEGKQVYEGRCHYIDIDSIGQNGNSKRVTIYKDAIHTKPIKKFISEDVVIKEVQDAKTN